MESKSRIPELKIDLDAPGSFMLFVKIESANNLAAQAEIVRDVIRLFAVEKMSDDEINRVVSELSVRDIKRIFDSIAAEGDAIKASPL